MASVRADCGGPSPVATDTSPVTASDARSPAANSPTGSINASDNEQWPNEYSSDDRPKRARDEWAWRSCRSRKLDDGTVRLDRACQGLLMCSNPACEKDSARPSVHERSLNEQLRDLSCDACDSPLKRKYCSATSVLFRDDGGRLLRFEHSGRHDHARPHIKRGATPAPSPKSPKARDTDAKRRGKSASVEPKKRRSVERKPTPEPAARYTRFKPSSSPVEAPPVAPAFATPPFASPSFTSPTDFSFTTSSPVGGPSRQSRSSSDDASGEDVMDSGPMQSTPNDPPKLMTLDDLVDELLAARDAETAANSRRSSAITPSSASEAPWADIAQFLAAFRPDFARHAAQLYKSGCQSTARLLALPAAQLGSFLQQYFVAPGHMSPFDSFEFVAYVERHRIKPKSSALGMTPESLASSVSVSTPGSTISSYRVP